MQRMLMTLGTSCAFVAALALTAQAQTIVGKDSSGAVIYTLDLNQSKATPGLNLFTYSYVATLDSFSAATVNVNSFNFNFAPDAMATYASSPGYGEGTTGPGSFIFGATNGLQKVGDQATFNFTSPLPPLGSVAVGTTSSGQAGGGTTTFAPSAAPEPSALAVFGIGSLPLALLALRRKARASARNAS